MRLPDGQPAREPLDSDASGPARVVLGVSGGVAAYKACELLRRLTESGHDVTVVPTPAALRFVGSVTWEALSGKPVSSDVFADVSTVRHVALGQSADLVVVAPATADLLARAASGRADDLLTSTLLAAIEEHQARVVILDVTGVPIIDSQVARVLLEAAAAARLLGATPMLVGLRPELAQTIVGLGLDLATLITLANLKTGLHVATQMLGQYQR